MSRAEPDDRPFPDVSGRPKGPVDAASWEERWRTGETGWENGIAGPPFVRALGQGLVTPPGRALVPGCGSGHDARLLAGAGFETVGVDVSPLAVRRARGLAEVAGAEVTFLEADVLALPHDAASFDLVLEHTCFCAIHPDERDRYVEEITRVLRPGGRLLGLFFMIEPEQGPPFGTSDAEIRHRFGGAFTVDVAEVPPEPHRCPHGREHLYLMTRRAGASMAKGRTRL